MNKFTTKRITVLGINVALFVLYLLGWVKASLASMFSVETSSVSMFGLAGLMRDLSDLVETAVMWFGSGEGKGAVAAMNIITVVFYVLIIGMICGIAFNLWDTFFKSGKKILGYVVIAGITAFIILVVIIINAKLEKEIGYGSLIALSAAPFLALAVAGGGIFAVKKMPEGTEIGGSINSAVSSIKGSKAVSNFGSSIKSVAQKSSIGARRFPIYYYSASTRIRPISAQLVNSTGALKFDFVSYSTGPITAIRVTVELVTAFCEAIKLDTMSFINLSRVEEQYNVRYSTEAVNTGVDPDLLRQIREIRIYPTEVVINGELFKCTSTTEYKKTSIPLDQLDAMRAANGLDVMENISMEQDRWRCYCGTGNVLGQNCRLCGRPITLPAPFYNVNNIPLPAPGYNANNNPTPAPVDLVKNNQTPAPVNHTDTNGAPGQSGSICPACGEVLNRETKFCYKCGAKLK